MRSCTGQSFRRLLDRCFPLHTSLTSTGMELVCMDMHHIHADFRTIALVCLSHRTQPKLQDCGAFVDRDSRWMHHRCSGRMAPVSFYRTALLAHSFVGLSSQMECLCPSVCVRGQKAIFWTVLIDNSFCSLKKEKDIASPHSTRPSVWTVHG